MIPHIRVASKEELKARILAYLDDLNRQPVIHTWTYNRLRKFGFTERYRFDSLTSSIRWRTWTDAWCRPSDCCDVQLP